MSCWYNESNAELLPLFQTCCIGSEGVDTSNSRLNRLISSHLSHVIIISADLELLEDPVTINIDIDCLFLNRTQSVK